MAIIVIDGVRRLQRPRQSPRFGEERDARHDKRDDEIAHDTSWELPNGGARVVGEATVQQPERQRSAFERRGLKTRLPESVDTAPHEPLSAASTEGAKASSADQNRMGAQPVKVLDSAGTAPSADLTPPPEAADKVTPPQRAQQPDAAVAAEASDQQIHDAINADVEEHNAPAARDQSVLAVERIASERSVPERSVSERPAFEPARAASDNDVSEGDRPHTATKPQHPAEDDQELAPEPFSLADDDAIEDEKLDDPRYEGLSELLWRRPMDGVAHLKEFMAERRKQKAAAREAARIRRHELRARRAAEKEQRRHEKEERLAREREDARALQQGQHPQRRHHSELQRSELQRSELNHSEFEPQSARASYRTDPLAPLDDDDPLFSPSLRDDRERDAGHTSGDDGIPHVDPHRHSDGSDRESTVPADDNEYRPAARPPDVERAYRHLVNGAQARETLASATEVIAIAVMAREGGTFEGLVLLKLLLACGLRYCPTTRMFHRFESDDDQSPLQFSVIDTLKPGEFPLDDMAHFSTKGIWLLMPMPGARELSMAFEAMYETARAVARYLNGDLRDENQSVITAQTVEFSRQRVQEFERRAKLHRATH